MSGRTGRTVAWIALSLAGIVGLWRYDVIVHRIDGESKLRAQQIENEQRQRAIDQCHQTNVARQNLRDTFNDFIDVLISATERPDSTPRTPGQEADRQEAIAKFRSDFKARIDRRLPNQDCATLPKPQIDKST